jgi:hypothetical protein
MRIIFQVFTVSAVVTAPFSLVYMILSTRIAIANISGLPVAIASDSFLDIFNYPGFWVFYARSATWLFLGCFLTSALALLMIYMKRRSDYMESEMQQIENLSKLKKRCVMAIRNFPHVLIASIMVAIPLVFISIVIIPVAGNFLDILAYPEFWISRVKDILLYFFGCFSTSILTLFIASQPAISPHRLG